MSKETQYIYTFDEPIGAIDVRSISNTKFALCLMMLLELDIQSENDRTTVLEMFKTHYPERLI